MQNAAPQTDLLNVIPANDDSSAPANTKTNGQLLEELKASLPENGNGFTYDGHFFDKNNELNVLLVHAGKSINVTITVFDENGAEGNGYFTQSGIRVELPPIDNFFKYIIWDVTGSYEDDMEREEYFDAARLKMVTATL